MVYNPPVDKSAEDDKAVPPAVIVPVNPMRRGAYVEQAQRATIWAALYVLGWLLMRLSCYIGLPDDCILAEEPLEVLTDFVTLLVFALVQAWFCEIMEERRFRSLRKKYYFPATVVIAAIALSAINVGESLTTPQDEDGLNETQSVVFILLLILTCCFLVLHFAEAWKILERFECYRFQAVSDLLAGGYPPRTEPSTAMLSSREAGVSIGKYFRDVCEKVLPGAHLISGRGVPRIQIQEDLWSIYIASRGIILLFFILYLAFSINDNGGWAYQHYLMAWVLSLFAQFKAGFSVVWLGITTGIFLQGIGAYRINFLCDERVAGDLGSGSLD